MHVCLDVSPVVHRKAGLATYAQRLAEHLLALDNDDEFEAFHYDAHPRFGLPASLASLPRRCAPLTARRWRGLVAARALFGHDMDDAFGGSLRGFDIFHATEHLLPPLARAKTVFTFHDAIYALFPQHHLPMNRLFLKVMMPRFLRRADAIIAISECSKRDAVRLYGVDPDRITVIYEAADASLAPVRDPAELARVREKYRIPQDYVLSLGTIEPRKNLATLLDAYRALIANRETEPPALVIAGRKGWMFQPVFDRVKELGLSERLIFTDYVPQADAAALYCGALAFVFPSLYEGFGLPPLEAMACGAAVICSNASSLPEVVGDAALLVDPLDVRGLSAAIERVIGDAALRATLSERGQHRAAQFSWARAATETRAVYAATLRAAG